MKKMSIERICQVAYDVFGVKPTFVRSTSVLFLIPSVTSIRLDLCNFPYFYISYSEYFNSMTLTVFTIKPL